MGEKALEQLNIIIVSYSNTALVVQRIKDDLIDMLDFQNNSGKSDLRYTNIASVLSERETESKQKKSGETRPGFVAYLLSDGYPIQKLEIPNLKFEIPN